MNNNSEDSLIEENANNNNDIDSYQDNDIDAEEETDQDNENNDDAIIDEDVSNSDVDEEEETDQDNENNDDANTIMEEDDSDDDIINDKIIDDEDDFKVVNFKETINNMYEKKDKKTIPVLTKYEKARVLGYRAKQIECGAKPFIDPGDMISSIDIAKKELYSKKLPFIIRRPLPDGTFEDWPIQELIITV